MKRGKDDGQRLTEKMTKEENKSETHSPHQVHAQNRPRRPLSLCLLWFRPLLPSQNMFEGVLVVRQRLALRRSNVSPRQRRTHFPSINFLSACPPPPLGLAYLSLSRSSRSLFLRTASTLSSSSVVPTAFFRCSRHHRTPDPTSRYNCWCGVR